MMTIGGLFWRLLGFTAALVAGPLYQPWSMADWHRAANDPRIDIDGTTRLFRTMWPVAEDPWGREATGLLALCRRAAPDDGTPLVASAPAAGPELAEWAGWGRAKEFPRSSPLGRADPGSAPRTGRPRRGEAPHRAAHPSPARAQGVRQTATMGVSPWTSSAVTSVGSR
jgi:hypothetical protein